MATITVSAEQIENHLNEKGLTIQSFEWSNGSSRQPNFDFSVDEDLEIEDPDLVDITELKEVEEQLDQLNIDHAILQKQFDELTIKYNELVASKTRSWKFWK